MTESKGGLSPQAREFVAVGASVGAGCHPCVTHHLKAGTGVGLGAQALLAAITAAERVTADSSARMAQHARQQLPAASEGPGGTVRAATLAALGAAVAANSMPNIERYLAEAAQLDVSRDELADAVNVAHEVQQNAAGIHAQRTERLLDVPQEHRPRAGPGRATHRRENTGDGGLRRHGVTHPATPLCWVRRAEGPLRRARWTPAQEWPRCQAQGEVR